MTMDHRTPSPAILDGCGPTNDGASSEEIRFSLERPMTMDGIEAAWKELDRAGTPSFFRTWTWIGTWLDALPRSCTPHLLTASIGDKPIGAAILFARRMRRHGLLGTSQLHFNSTGDHQL